MASVMFSHIGMQGEDIIEHTNTKCHLCTHWLTYTSLCNIGLNVLMPRY